MFGLPKGFVFSCRVVVVTVRRYYSGFSPYLKCPYWCNCHELIANDKKKYVWWKKDFNFCVVLGIWEGVSALWGCWDEARLCKSGLEPQTRISRSVNILISKLMSYISLCFSILSLASFILFYYAILFLHANLHFPKTSFRVDDRES